MHPQLVAWGCSPAKWVQRSTGSCARSTAVTSTALVRTVLATPPEHVADADRIDGIGHHHLRVHFDEWSAPGILAIPVVGPRLF